jgi:hypothetical protein
MTKYRLEPPFARKRCRLIKFLSWLI